MKICGHIIAKEEIIGIGPLMIQQSKDQAMRMLYNSKQLWFYLHLRNQSIKIESEWFDVGTSTTPDDIQLHNRRNYKKFADEYDEAVKVIQGLISEHNELIQDNA